MSSSTIIPDPEPYELITVLAELIQNQLQLQKGRVIIYNQKFDIPTDDGMFVAVSFVSDRVFGNNLVYENDPDNEANLVEIHQSHAQEMYEINVYSRDASARLRKHEILWALNSTEAQNLAEQYAFKIGFVPQNFTDVSEVEASARLNRYSFTFNILRAYETRRTVPAYTQFQIPPRFLITNP